MEKLYSERKNRDEAARKLIAEGHQVKRGNVRNQQLHPQYIEDVPSDQTGFGNTDYQRVWGTLYTLEIV